MNNNFFIVSNSMKWKYLISSLNMGYPVLLIIVHMMGKYTILLLMMNTL